MFTLYDRVYFLLRNSEVKKAIIKLRKLKTSAIFQCLTRECWNSDIQYDVLLKDYDTLLIKVSGRKKDFLIKYHKANVIDKNELKIFINKMNFLEVDKGVYITTGNFEEEYKDKKLKIVDGKSFVKDQLGITGTSNDVFGNKKIRFYRYLPD